MMTTRERGEAGDEVRCPFCDAADTEPLGLFGSQLMLGQWRCRACRSYFEALRDDRRTERSRPGQRRERPRLRDDEG
jgi:hypothetical protein